MALTREISDSIEELKKRQEWFASHIVQKKRELEKKNRYKMKKRNIKIFCTQKNSMTIWKTGKNRLKEH